MPPTERRIIPTQTTGSNSQNGFRTSGRGRHGAPAIRHKVLRRIEAAAGVTVYCNELASDLGASDSGVKNAVNALQKTIPQIVTVVRGQAWRWAESAGAQAKVQVQEPVNFASPEPVENGPLLFEEVGRGKDSLLILKGSDGNVYKAERI